MQFREHFLFFLSRMVDAAGNPKLFTEEAMLAAFMSESPPPQSARKLLSLAPKAPFSPDLPGFDNYDDADAGSTPGCYKDVAQFNLALIYSEQWILEATGYV